MSCFNLLRSKIIEGKSLMIILGSGGHTGEILIMLKKLELEKFSRIFFVSSHNDKNSENKAKEYLALNEKENKNIKFLRVYRSRNVGQSYLTSILTTIISIINSFYLLLITRPNLVKNYLLNNNKINFFYLIFLYLIEFKKDSYKWTRSINTFMLYWFYL